MGLGKTVQVAYALSVLKPNKVKIVCPLSMVNTWLTELEKWWPEGGFSKCPGGNRVILHYEGLKAASPADVIIFDEAHRLKNRKSQRSKTARQLSSKSGRVWLLTGTPIMNRAEEMWHLLHLIAPKQFTSYWNFVYEHCLTAPSRWSSSGVEILPGVRNEQSFARMLAPHSLRRTKLEVKLDLPKVTRQEHWLDMLPEQAALHKEILSELKVEICQGQKLTIYNTLTRTIRARQCATDPRVLGVSFSGCKQQALADLLEGLDEKVIVFSQWSKPLHSLFNEVRQGKSKERSHYWLHGQQSEVVRSMEITSWRKSKEPSVLLATIGAGGVGLTLTEASTVIFLDTTWVPAEIEQAIARVDRVGQEKPVTVHFLLAKGSVEQAVWKLLGQKTKMVEAINAEIEMLGR